MTAVRHPYPFTAELPELDGTPIDATVVRYPSTPSPPAATATATGRAVTPTPI